MSSIDSFKAASCPPQDVVGVVVEQGHRVVFADRPVKSSEHEPLAGGAVVLVRQHARLPAVFTFKCFDNDSC